MRRLFVIIGIVITSTAYSQTAPPHLQFFGFALVDVLWDDPHDAVATTNYITEVDSFSNLAQLGIYTPTDNIITRVQLMNELCVKPLLSIQSIFFEYVDTIAPSGVNYNLLANYEDRWNTFKTINNTILNAEKIGAFYIADEPTWTGITYDELNAVCVLLQADFPDIPIMFVEAYTVLDSLIIPVDADWVGFDKYGIYNPDSDVDYLSDLALLKSKRSNPAQKIIIIIDDQWLPLYGWAGYAPEDIEGMVQNYYELASNDTAVIGLLGYLWAGGLDDPEQLGVRNLPQNVIDKNVEIGLMITQNNPGCVNTIIHTSNFNETIQLFPNPAAHYITIQTQVYPQKISIYNVMGVLIYSEIIRSATSISTSNFPAGTYFLCPESISMSPITFIIE